MSHSSHSVPPRKRPGRTSRPSRGRPPQRSRIPAITLGLLATAVACGSIATGAYFAFRDDVFAGLAGRQTETQITYEDQIAALRARVDRVTSQQSLDKEQVEQQVKALLERQATFEQRTSPSADESIQTRNGWPASGTVDSSPLLSPIERPSAPIVAIPAESAKQANQVTLGHKKAHRPHRKHARVIRKRTHKPPTIAAGAYAGPANQQNY